MKIMSCMLALAFCLWVRTPLAAQDLVPKAVPQDGAVLLLNAEIHPVNALTIARGWLHFAEGRITALGPGDPPERGDLAAKTQIDLQGRQVWPGLISAHTSLGLEEIENIAPSTDLDEVGDLNTEVVAAFAVNPDSTLIPVARAAGILTAGVFPTSGVIAGRGSLMALDGWTWKDMAIAMDAALYVNWPRMDIVNAPWMDLSEAEQRRRQRESIAAIENAFRRAKAYFAARAADESRPIDLALEGFAAFMPERGPGNSLRPPRRPVFFSARQATQIRAVLRLSAEFGLRPVIVGGMEALACADELRARDVPVILLGTLRTPERSDMPYDEAYTLPSRFHAAKIRFALGSGDSNGHQRQLAHHAGMAAAYGLDADHAMRAITLEVAKIFEVDERIGALGPGMDATLIVTNGDPLEVTTVVEHAWIRGQRIILESKQSALRDKYRERKKP